MLNLKKTAVALALSSSAAFAGTMGPVCTPGNVTVPCERTAWDFGGYALYLQPTLSAGHGYDFFDEGFDGFRRYRHFDRDWGWGFKIEGSYHFHTGNDFNVNWYHLDRKHERRFSSFSLITPPAFPFFAGAPGFGTSIRTRFEPKWDAVNFEVGQHVDFSEWSVIRFHGGAQWAQVKHEYRSHLFSPFLTTLPVFAPFIAPGLVSPFLLARAESKFDGFGPRFGADMSYNLGSGFDIYANGATALLIGQSKFHSLRGPIPFLFTPVVGIPGRGSRTTMVPEMDAKLGARYTYAMAQGDLTLDAGYMWVNYWNVNHILVGHFGGHFDVRENNFALNGPYFGLKWVGNV